MTCKVNIGSRYEGPALDRPALRQMPSHWVLEESRPVRRTVLSSGAWLAIVVVVGWLFVIIQTLRGLL